MEGVELTASAEVEIGGYHDLHNCIDCIGSGFLGPCKPLSISHPLWTTILKCYLRQLQAVHDEDLVLGTQS